jgi:hypothetical protein
LGYIETFGFLALLFDLTQMLDKWRWIAPLFLSSAMVILQPLGHVGVNRVVIVQVVQDRVVTGINGLFPSSSEIRTTTSRPQDVPARPDP